MADSSTRRTVESPVECIDLEDQRSPERDELGQPRQLAFRGQSRKFGTLVPSFRRLFVQRKMAEDGGADRVGAIKAPSRTLRRL